MDALAQIFFWLTVAVFHCLVISLFACKRSDVRWIDIVAIGPFIVFWPDDYIDRRRKHIPVRLAFASALLFVVTWLLVWMSNNVQ